MFDAKAWIEYGGLLLVFLAIYGQTGLFFCFFIPSGALMFATGAMIASHDLEYNITIASCLLVAAAVLGNMTGYLFGRKAGALLYNKPDSRFFKKEHITKAERFYEKYGGRALSFGLFLPIVRTFAPIAAGIVRLKVSRFLCYVILGSLSWVLSFLLTGYWVGSRPVLKPYLKYIIVGIVVLVSTPVVFKIVKEFNKKERREQYI